jgi:lipopolysaccharide/colanic/teichoic acid biosynthesis glycosyltransferase
MDEEHPGIPTDPSIVPGYKRPFDLVCGATMAVIFSPIWALATVLIKLTSPGPVFFKQERVGQDGRPFTMYKFRTMWTGVDITPHRDFILQYMEGKPAPNQDGVIYKLRRDPRITPVGKALRRLGLDELPQLLNVFRGEMSIVGPRPPLAYEVERYTERHRRRLEARPGMTGLWQVFGRDLVDFETMISMDLEYIDRQSLHLDAMLVVLTLPMVILSHLVRRSRRHPVESAEGE